MCVPFSGKEFTFTQPDGTALRVRGWGNQYHAVFETLNGYTVVEDPTTHFYHYASLARDGNDLVPTGALPRKVNPASLDLRTGLRVSRAAARAKAKEPPGLPRGNSRWEQRRREFRESLHLFSAAAAAPGIALAPPKRETVGEFLGLCLLIQFPDVQGTLTRDQVEAFCNSPGYSGFGNNGSVFDYFNDVSAGRLRYRNIIAPYYTAQHPRKYYTDESVDQPIRARELIKEALEFHRAQGFDFSMLTIDAKQLVYATNIFYAGPCINNWSKGLWPHSHYLQTPFQLDAGRSAYDYQITNMGDELTLGTFCHENGHMICDFPDLYDYGNQSAGVGFFCLMCGGPNADEKNPPQVGAYLKYKAGWAQGVTNLAAGFAGNVVANTNRFFIRRKAATEYFLIENRFKQGRDSALPGSGLAIWHVDELGDNQDEEMTTAQHYECALMQADGRNDLESDSQNNGDATDLFAESVNVRFGDNTNPNSKWWDRTSSGLDISAISAAGSAMTFSCEA